MRLALGVCMAFALGQLIGWPLAHLASPLTAMLLLEPAPQSTASARTILRVASLAMLANFLIALFLLPYLPVMILAIALVLYRFYIFIQVSNAPGLSIIGALVGSIIVPVLVHQMPEIAVVASIGLLADFATAILASWTAFVLIPAPDSPPESSHEPPPLEEVVPTAATLALVMTPLLATFLVFGWTKVLVLAYAAIFATSMSATGSLEKGWGKVIANLVFGGVGALLLYEVFVMVPSVPFMIATVFSACAFYAFRIFGGGPSSEYWSSGFLGFLILLGGALLADDVVVSANIIARAVQLCAAAAYVVLAFSVVELSKGAWARVRMMRHASGIENPG